ncbi:hypothetical protein RSAG8_09438, partial [Rhizoctonia solani AG-8 WAC10335]
MPITSLPSEILAHIFHLVAKPCDLIVVPKREPVSWNSTSSEGSSADSERRLKKIWHLKNFPTHLDNLTHVCSHWRQIAIATPSLWTHIDILPHESLHRGLLARAETYVTRATQLPIKLHVADTIRFGYSDASFGQFLSSVSSRVESLDVAVIYGRRSFHDFIFAKLFSPHTTRSKNFTKLTTNFAMVVDRINEFITPFDVTDDAFHFTTLHLGGLFPCWDSKVYYNLVDLRLQTAPHYEHWTRIREQELRIILEASPRLQIFHFALLITNRQRDDESVIPVRLNDLAVLSIFTDRDELDPILKPGHVLRLLAPGSKPLRLSLWHNFHVYDSNDDDIHLDDLSLNELAKFFQRSNLIKFCSKDECPQLDWLLSYASNLEDLTLDSCSPPLLPCSPVRSNNPITPRLHSLILQNCFLSLDQLEVILQQCPTGLLTLSKCNWTTGEIIFEAWNPVRRVSELLERYPVTKLIFQPSNPIWSWDFIE